MRTIHHFLTVTTALIGLVGCSSTVRATDEAPTDAGTVSDVSSLVTDAPPTDTAIADNGAPTASTDAGFTGRWCGSDPGPCPAGYFCYFTAAEMCSAADAPGVCQPVPASCPPISQTDPTCGCDGVTYNSPCLANLAGQGVLHPGACIPPTCQSTGCDAGSTCEQCRSMNGPIWVCLPGGAQC